MMHLNRDRTLWILWTLFIWKSLQ